MAGKGLVLVQTKPMFAVFYLDIHNALPQDAGVYADAAYNREIQALFAPKAIQPAPSWPAYTIRRMCF